jgi:hypothetical protein
MPSSSEKIVSEHAKRSNGHLLIFPQYNDETEHPQEHLVADQDINPDEDEATSSLSDLSMNGSAELEAPNRAKLNQESTNLKVSY